MLKVSELHRLDYIYFRKSTKVWGFFACLVQLIFILPTSADQERLPNLLKNEHQLSMSLKTPHTKWAKPYAGGATRVLFITPWYQGSTEGREIIELMQRFELEADVAYYLKGAKSLLGDNNPRPYVYRDAGTQRVLRLLKKEYDVFFLNHTLFESLPVKVQEIIHRQIDNGSGIVIVGNSVKVPFKNAKHLKHINRLSNSAKCYSIGKGRAVLQAARLPLKFEVGWETKFDYQMAEQGRSLLWAANRFPDFNLSLNLTSKTINRKELTTQKVILTWNKAPVDAMLELNIRRWDGHTQLLGKYNLSTKKRLVLPLPLLRAGKYHLIAIVQSNKGKEDWQVEPFQVVSQTGITGIKLVKDWAERNEFVKGSVKLNGQIDAKNTIQTRLVDKRGRILAQQTAVVGDKKSRDFKFKMQKWMPMLLRVEAILIEGDREVSSAYTYLRVTNRHQNQYNFVVWNYPTGDLAPYGLKSFAKHGVTAVLQGGEPSLGMAAFDLSFVPYASSYRKSSHTVTAMLDGSGIMKGGGHKQS